MASLAGSAAFAQQPVEPWKAPHFSIDPKDLYVAASAVAAPEGADVTLLEDDESYTFDDAGRTTHTVYAVYKVLTQKGAEGWDSGSIEWEPWHESRPTIKVRVIEPDFAVHTLDPKSINEAPARGGDYKVYSDGKVLRAPFPAISAGVVVEEEFQSSETEPLFVPGRVGEMVFGRERVPVAHSQALFEAPASLPLRTGTLLLNDLKPVRTEANGRVTLTYEMGPLAPFEARDPYLPPDLAHYPEIRFSTGVSWQNMATEYAKIVDKQADVSAVQAIVDKLIAGKTTVADKEMAIVDYLDREVRYTGIEFAEAAIVPHALAETLGHKYGDCKDKATLLVAMLRAAGIPANVALLNAGSRMDVPAELPGMGLFDHAIVYVPGPPSMWIDATDQYARLGQLPIDDQGRMALIAQPDTTSLTKTPESASKDNVLLEYREMTLSENGPATVTEKTQPMGVFESNYRSYYADKPDKETRDGLTGYVKNQYVAEKLTSVDRTDPGDLSKQFELTLACDKARRGYTDLDSGVAAIRLDSLFQRLPDELKRKDDSEEKKKDDKDKPKAPRTADWWLNEPFKAEWYYKIVPPPGFVAKEVPQDTKIPLGPALLTEEFLRQENGVVEAHLTFDSVKRRYTVGEAKELSAKAAELISGPAIMVNFEPQGEALLHEGKVREALASYRKLVTLHPNEAVHHLQVAKVLLEAGMGEAARAEARLAVKLDPNSALAEKTLAEILKHDLVGREMRAGSDLAGAAEAFRSAAKLDPDDHSAQGNLAILLEYEPVGRRYGRLAKMKDAVKEYDKLGQDKLADLGIANNLAFARFYAGDAAGAFKDGQALNPQPTSLLAASEAVMNGSKAGLAEANKRSNDNAAFKDAAKTAGEMLMNVRQYALAADFMEAGASGDNAAQTVGRAALLRTAPHHEDMKFANTPADLVKHAFLLSMDPDVTLEKMEGISSRNALTVMKNDDPDDLKRMLNTGKELNSQMARQDSSLDVTMDILLAAIDPKSDGDDTIGYREKVQTPFGANITFFVVKENGEYRLLDSNERPNSIGLEVLDRIKAGDLKGAKALLDWLREDQHLAGGDDELGGPVFPRFWTKGQAADARKMTMVAGAILAGSRPTAAQGVAVLEAAQASAVGDREKTNIELALVDGYSLQDNFTKLLAVSSALLNQVPESKLAFSENIEALIGLGRFDDAIALADARLKLLDGDTDALRMKMETEADRGNFTAARAWGQKLIDQGKADADLLNSSAWFALFTGKVDDADITMGIKATQMATDNAAILHTLACLYAEVGKTKEAHDVLLRGMDDLNLDEPNDDYWYAFGRIAEQYGERDIAIADYKKLEKPKHPLAIPISTWTLAQNRLKAMGAEAGTVGKAE
jgi:tetratricopeptide (TPR) repeat protein/transglutaminase-like putative cysteine protease